MKINTLETPEVNQNGYHKNTLTKERIGALFIYPIDLTPDDCFSCEGYSLLIEDYKELYKVIGTKFNQDNDAAGTFRIPDYNITGRFLQPGSNAGEQIDAGLPNITGALNSLVTFDLTTSGSFACSYGQGKATTSNGSPWEYSYTNFDASRSSAIYGNSTTVQPSSQLVHICIKYK